MYLLDYPTRNVILTYTLYHTHRTYVCMFPSMRLLCISSQPPGYYHNPGLGVPRDAKGTETFNSKSAENWKHI